MAETLVALPYAFDALEPHMDARTMEIHHDKHHAAYVANYNKALEGRDDLTSKPAVEVLSNLDAVPAEIRTAVRNHGGGVVNHNLFWACMSPDGGGEPDGDLARAIADEYGDFAAFKAAFSKAAATRFGSGWAWLGVKPDGKLAVFSTPNQDSPIMRGVTECDCAPILTLDIWEHSYYLNYQNRRPDYIAAFWNVIDWKAVAERFAAAK